MSKIEVGDIVYVTIEGVRVSGTCIMMDQSNYPYLIGWADSEEAIAGYWILDSSYDDSDHDYTGAKKIFPNIKKALWVNKSCVYLKEKGRIINPSDGSNCKKCNNFSKYSESNQDDGSFICYSCDTNRWAN